MKLRQFVVLLASMLALTAAQAQTSVRVRGAITAVDGNILSVKSRDGQDLKITMADNVAVSVAQAVRFEEFKPGDKVGVTTIPGANGMPIAIEVHERPPTVPEGQGPWDLQPGSTMTNASVAAVVTDTARREITLEFKGTTEKVAVPESAALARSIPGTRGDLIVGQAVFMVAQATGDGKLSATRIQVGKDGVKPPL
jgi:hypothetical protein